MPKEFSCSSCELTISIGSYHSFDGVWITALYCNTVALNINYKNRLLSVSLAERRMENTNLLLKQGKALTRDLLDAQDDLLSSRNEATIALIDYTINRLSFWNAIERFKIDPKGMWYEQVDSDTEGPVATP